MEDAEALIAQLLYDRLVVMMAAVLQLAKARMVEDQFVVFAADVRSLFERASPYGGVHHGSGQETND